MTLFTSKETVRYAISVTIWVLFAAAAAAAGEIVVAADGTGDVRTVQSAIDRVPDGNKERVVIRIKPGVYTEQVKIPASKPYISLIGSDAETTVIRYKISAKDAGSTSAAFAVYIGGHDTHASNITFENTYGIGSQAVAVLVEADRTIFRKCRFLGWQDTLYTKNARQYFEDCYIEGSVDYIFGQSAAFFERCHLHTKSDGYITAPMRFAADEPAGLVFNGCRITTENTKNGVYLGRPWRDYGRSVFLNTTIDGDIRPEGWHHWLPEREQTAFLAEYRSTGPKADTSQRVAWAKILTDKQADDFGRSRFLAGRDGWDPATADDKWLIANSPSWKPLRWPDVIDRGLAWYQTDEAARLGDQLILFQRANGGWEKNIDMAAMLTAAEKARLVETRNDIRETTIDNGATHRQLVYLAKLISASAEKSSPPSNFPKYKESFYAGLDYLFSAQYDNGGWPQIYPLRKGYYSHITFNDDAMIGVLRLLRDVANGKADYDFVDAERKAKAAVAVAKGLSLVLKLQVVIDGKRTVWAAQYDEKTLQPAAARAFEPVSLTAGESVSIVRFLMQEPRPSADIVGAIHGAISWYEDNAIKGIRWVRKNGENSVEKDATAPPIWGRFYKIETMRPIFIGRDGVIKYDVMQIEAERRNGYAWYVESPRDLIAEYGKWKQKQASK